MTNDKIPIGTITIADPDYYHVKIKLRKGIIVKLDDIITLDMIQPYESEAVRKVETYIHDYMNHSGMGPNFREFAKEYWINHARNIVKLVHEAEDSDE